MNRVRRIEVKSSWWDNVVDESKLADDKRTVIITKDEFMSPLLIKFDCWDLIPLNRDIDLTEMRVNCVKRSIAAQTVELSLQRLRLVSHK